MDKRKAASITWALSLVTIGVVGTAAVIALKDVVTIPISEPGTTLLIGAGVFGSAVYARRRSTSSR